MSILVINAGSSSLKFGLFAADGDDALATALIDWTADPRRAELVIQPRQAAEVRYPMEVSDHRAALEHALRTLTEMRVVATEAIAAVGHRVVHGGTDFHDSIRIDQRVKDTNPQRR